MKDSMDHKPGLLMILSGKHGKDDASDDGDDQKEMKRSAMEDFISAVASKDADKALDAFKDLCDLHGSYSDSDDDSEEE